MTDGKIKLWCSFSAEGTGQLTCIKERMTRALYSESKVRWPKIHLTVGTNLVKTYKKCLSSVIANKVTITRLEFKCCHWSNVFFPQECANKIFKYKSHSVSHSWSLQMMNITDLSHPYLMGQHAHWLTTVFHTTVWVILIFLIIGIFYCLRLIHFASVRRILVAIMAFNISSTGQQPTREKHSEDSVLISVTQNWATGHLA